MSRLQVVNNEDLADQEYEDDFEVTNSLSVMTEVFFVFFCFQFYHHNLSFDF